MDGVELLDLEWKRVCWKVNIGWRSKSGKRKNRRREGNAMEKIKINEMDGMEKIRGKGRKKGK